MDRKVKTYGSIGESSQVQAVTESLSDGSGPISSHMKDKCVPRGLDRMLELAGNDIAVLVEMIEAVQRLIDRRNLVVESDTLDESTELA